MADHHRLESDRDWVGQVVEAALGPDGLATASFSESRKYRYRLSKVWDEKLPRVVWCMLNPSTATAEVSDPTINRVMKFSRAWRFGAAEVVNLFALRTPHPEVLRVASDPVGPENDRAISEVVESGDLVVAAWGNHGAVLNPSTGVQRAAEVRDLLRARDKDIHCLRLTKGSHPGHPLYLPSDLRPVMWNA